MLGNKGDLVRQIGRRWCRNAKLSSDCQVNDSAGDDEPCEQKPPWPVLAKLGLRRFQGSPARETENDAKWRKDKARSWLQELRMRIKVPSRMISRSAETRRTHRAWRVFPEYIGGDAR